MLISQVLLELVGDGGESPADLWRSCRWFHLAWRQTFEPLHPSFHQHTSHPQTPHPPHQQPAEAADTRRRNNLLLITCPELEQRIQNTRRRRCERTFVSVGLFGGREVVQRFCVLTFGFCRPSRFTFSFAFCSLLRSGEQTPVPSVGCGIVSVGQRVGKNLIKGSLTYTVGLMDSGADVAETTLVSLYSTS